MSGWSGGQKRWVAGEMLSNETYKTLSLVQRSQKPASEIHHDICPHPDENDCPVKTTLDIIDGKWKPLILHYLTGGPIRYGQLKRAIGNASRKVLTQQLRQLERDRIIHRRVIDGKICFVEYSYTPLGKTLVPVLVMLSDWGKTYRAERTRTELNQAVTVDAECWEKFQIAMSTDRPRHKSNREAAQNEIKQRNKSVCVPDEQASPLKVSGC